MSEIQFLSHWATLVERWKHRSWEAGVNDCVRMVEDWCRLNGKDVIMPKAATPTECNAWDAVKGLGRPWGGPGLGKVWLAPGLNLGICTGYSAAMFHHELGMCGVEIPSRALWFEV